MLSPRRLILAAADPRQAMTYQAHLRSALQLNEPVVRFEEVLPLLTPETDGDVLLFATDPSDVSAIETTIREARVRQLPARFAFAHGGKDGTPFPVDRATYDKTIEVLGNAINRSEIGRSEKVAAFKRLAALGADDEAQRTRKSRTSD